MINLHEHQVDMVEKTRNALRRNKHVVLQAPTGCGKSIMASFMIAASQNKNSRSIFTVPRKLLIDQMSENFKEFNLPHSFIAAGRSFNPHARTHIASLSSIRSRLSIIQKPNILFCDESHYGGSLLAEIIDHFKKLGCYIVELSATPRPGSGATELIQGPSVRYLIDRGFLSQYEMFAANFPDLSRIKLVNGEYHQAQLADAMENDDVIVGDAVTIYKKNAMGMRNLSFATSRKQAERINQRFKDDGVSSAVIDSKTPDDERVRIIRAYANREIFNLSTVKIATFGFDLAAAAGIKEVTVESMSDLAPTESLYEQLQKWGRVFRMKALPAKIFDHVGNGMKSPDIPKHGLPCWEREWDIRTKDKIDRDVERARPVRSCIGCFYVYSPHLPCCPCCGRIPLIRERVIKEVSGDLQKIDITAIKHDKKNKRMEIGMARTLNDLRKIQQDRGYDPSWIWVQAKVKGIKK